MVGYDIGMWSHILLESDKLSIDILLKIRDLFNKNLDLFNKNLSEWRSDLIDLVIYLLLRGPLVLHLYNDSTLGRYLHGTSS